MRYLVDIQDEKIIPHDKEAFSQVLKALNGKVASIEIEEEGLKKGKERLFAYYRGVLLPVFHSGLRGRGYNIDIDGVHQFYTMPKYGKDIKHNPLTGEMETVIISQAKWTKKRTQDFIDDLVIDLLEEFGTEAPDSAEYLADIEKQKKRRNLRILMAAQREWEK